VTTPETAPATSVDQAHPKPPTPPPSAPPAVANSDSPGRALRHARELRSLDVNYVATALRLSPQVVESIERDDYSGLPSAVFVSGYIRSYARLVGIDPEPLNQRFRQLHPEAEAPPRHFARPEQDLKGRDDSNPVLYLVTALIVLALAAAAFAWWSNRPQAERATGDPLSSEPRMATDTAATADSASAVDETDPRPGADPRQATPGTDTGETPSQEAVLAAAPTNGSTLAPEPEQSSASSTQAANETAPAADTAADAEGGPSEEPITEASPASASDDASASAPAENAPSEPTQSTGDTDQSAADTASAEDQPAPTPASDGGVNLAFTGPCWVDIRDATGSVLLFGEMARGDQETLDGEPPYSLVIGNAAAVEMTVGGTPYDVRAVARGNVARFEIDPRNLDSTSSTTTPETTD
jgi:cytoskeleton protein RodZ